MEKLENLYPDAKPELNFSNSFELLIATILSAQCTDVRVNKVTKELFKVFKTPEDFLSLQLMIYLNIYIVVVFITQKVRIY